MVCRNLWILAILHVLHNPYFGLPVIYLYLSSKGVSLEQFVLLQFAFSFTSLILELPTGWVADRWGRRPCAFLASIALTAGWSCYCFGDNLLWFIAAEVLMATALSFRSGTFEALCFDSLLDASRPDRTRPDGRTLFCIGYITSAVACLIGGALFLWSPDWTFRLSLPFLAVSIGVSLLLKEPQKHRPRPAGFWKAVIDCRKQLQANEPLRAILAFYAVVTGLMLCLAWCTQPYQKMVGVPVQYGAPLYAVMLLLHAILARTMQSWEEKYDIRILFAGFCVLLVAGICIAGLFPSVAGVLCLIIGRGCFGAITPVTTDVVQRASESSYRAMAFSFRTFLTRLVFCLTVPFVELGLMFFKLPTVMVGIGIAGAVAITVTAVYYRRDWAIIAHKAAHPKMNRGEEKPQIQKIGIKQVEVA